ncbi:MarR family winged helix-turn-helix transcriptional regulator [Pseudomonas plecoglossicida]|uniref:MarR family winged helix-turn-helix transcriptional regulator n=1 Tax=Pseudomonas plecoglossicida TaxID=70775 RepID=UPI00397796DD
MNLDCTCFRVRRLSRHISQLYDDALRPAGLRVTQFSLLSALKKNGTMTVTSLADYLGSDHTSISRALATLKSHDWVMLIQGGDKRSTLVEISNLGLEVVREATPHWSNAQQRISELLGSGTKLELDKRLDELFMRLSKL